MYGKMQREARSWWIESLLNLAWGHQLDLNRVKQSTTHKISTSLLLSITTKQGYLSTLAALQ
jgi:hypothetical protein